MKYLTPIYKRTVNHQINVKDLLKKSTFITCSKINEQEMSILQRTKSANSSIIFKYARYKEVSRSKNYIFNHLIKS